MPICYLLLLLSLILPFHSLEAKKTIAPIPSTASHPSLHTLYHSLDPLSVSQHFAFYELYPETEEGKEALEKAWTLLSADPELATTKPEALPKINLDALISLITRPSFEPPAPLSEEQLLLVEQISQRLHNRSLKGAQVWTTAEVLQLPPEQVDLSRGLLVDQLSSSLDSREQIRQYEAVLDLMALQILARLPATPTDLDKLHAINQFIFHEMQFRFPPHSVHAKDIDLYTFLPSVLDSRQGVCLGVSILYLSLSQRLDLPLEVITPPGHIYVRYNDGTDILNIETTARGIDLPSDTYLGLNTRSLQQRNIKEVIGLAFMNQASVLWAKEDYKTTATLYEKARAYLPDDPLLKMLLGFNYLFIGKKKEGLSLLKSSTLSIPDEAVCAETLGADYLGGKVDIEGIKAVFLPVDESRESILLKQKELEKILKRHPHYRAGLLMLATTWLQLSRGSEALGVLKRYHAIDPTHPIVEYYLAIINAQRLDYNASWSYLNHAETLTTARGHHPKALTNLREQLRHSCPE